MIPVDLPSSSTPIVGAAMNDDILLVDDDPATIQLLGRILSEVGALRFATGGKNAL